MYLQVRQPINHLVYHLRNHQHLRQTLHHSQPHSPLESLLFNPTVAHRRSPRRNQLATRHHSHHQVLLNHRPNLLLLRHLSLVHVQFLSHHLDHQVNHQASRHFLQLPIHHQCRRRSAKALWVSVCLTR